MRPRDLLSPAMIAPIAGISVFGISLSMSYPLFGLTLEGMGVSGAVIGLNQMAAAVAMVLAAPILPAVLAWLGMKRLVIGAGLLLALVMLLIPLWTDLIWWAGLRALYGFAATALFFATEYWIVAAAPPGQRGRFVALYTITLAASFMAGPVILGLIGGLGLGAFFLAAAVMGLGMLPILWGLPYAPPAEEKRPTRPGAALRFFVTDPALVWGVVLFGMIEFGVMGLLTVWGLRAGLAAEEAVLLLAVFGAGSMAFQLPLGWAAERAERRWLLALAAATAVAMPLAMAAGAPVFWSIAPFCFLWGGLAVALYSIALIELGARYTGTKLSEGNAAVILAYGIGALASPGLFGVLMDRIPPHGLLYGAAVLAALYLGLVTVRIARTRPKPLDSEGPAGG